MASGAANMPWVAQMRQAVPQRIDCFTAFDYRNPQRLPPDDVLIVGAAAAAVQLAYRYGSLRARPSTRLST
jgi:cation diffusion facilitator CzcD-associated flavoprotein CzcO